MKEERIRKEKKKMLNKKKKTYSAPISAMNNGEIEMALPPSRGNATQAKRGRLFSKPLFREALHSNRMGLAIVSVGNGIIMVIIIAILSTLHINSTSTALKDLFENADYENTIKSSTISLYSSYKNTSEAYQLFLDKDTEAQSVFEKEVSLVDDSTLNSSISTAKTLYNVTYRLTSGDENTKKTTAKNTTMSVVNTTIDNASMSDTEKKLSKSIISSYFDVYMEDTSKSTSDILKTVIPSVLSDEVIETYSLTGETKEKVQDIFSSTMKKVKDENQDIKNVKIESTFSLLPLLADETQADFLNNVVTDLSAKYEEDKEKYVSDDTIRQDIVDKNAQNYVMDTLEGFAYYQYLPSFTVEYKTSDLGWPVRMVPTGTYSDNGNEIMKEMEVKTYNPSVFIKENEKMGKSSNMLQKMRKKALTGEDYTEEEIAKAKEEASSDLDQIRNRLASFMKEYRKNENGEYSSEKSETSIKNKVLGEVAEEAKKTLVKTYNDKNDVEIYSIEEITKENSSMSGEEMISLVDGYATSAIASFETYQKENEEKYSTIDCLLLSMNKASNGVMSLLPASVDESLKEMGNMNTYGIIVGVVSFGIAALLIPMVYSILLAKSLVSEKVETGSLAFTMSTPIKRESFIFTQASYLIFSEIVMALSLLAFSLVTRGIGIMAGSTDIASSLPVTDICLYALGNFMVCLAISGINFFTSCHFNKTSQSIGVGGGITIFFFICSILGLFATKAIPGTIRINMMNIFNYMTLDSLFDALAVMDQDYGKFFFKLAFLLLITLVTYIAGALRFRKKDLPL